jgi:flavin reductase (DIM6/NTAB) family NADH-FMN oxidoreductase RutF
MQINISAATLMEKQNWLQYAIAPRPIAFASTVDANGNVNLSPFSFFNLVSYHPSIVVFSTVLRGRDGTKKDTLQNILQVPEVAINICDYEMVQQLSLASCEYPKDINEFIKAGFTEEKSSLIKPPLVKESKVKMECKVLEIKSLGDNGGAGQLVIAEVLLMHIDESILTDDNATIDQTKLHHVARLGGDWYCKVDASNLFKVAKPNRNLGIGFDGLPAAVRNSIILSGNDLGQLANVQEIPAVDASFDDDILKNIIQYYSISPDEMEKELHIYAKQLLQQNKVNEAWQILLASV